MSCCFFLFHFFPPFFLFFLLTSYHPHVVAASQLHWRTWTICGLNLLLSLSISGNKWSGLIYYYPFHLLASSPWFSHCLCITYPCTLVWRFLEEEEEETLLCARGKARKRENCDWYETIKGVHIQSFFFFIFCVENFVIWIVSTVCVDLNIY